MDSTDRTRVAEQHAERYRDAWERTLRDPDSTQHECDTARRDYLSARSAHSYALALARRDG